MKKSLAKLLTFVSNLGAFAFISVLFAGTLVFSNDSSYIITGNKISAPAETSECQNVDVSVNKESGFFGGTTIRFSSKSDSKCIESKYKKSAFCPELTNLFKSFNWVPKRIHLKTMSDRIIGSFTEIDSSVRGIYFGARHVIQQLSLKEAGTQLNEYEIYEVQSKYKSSEVYDILILVDKKVSSSISDWISQYLKSTFEPSSNNWFSLQSGEDGSLSSPKQISCGQNIKTLLIPGSSYEDFSLSSLEGNSNFTSPASSGSLVWTYKTYQSGSESIYIPEITGIINCQQQPAAERISSHSNQLPTTHVLSFRRLFNEGIIEKIDLKQALDKKVSLEKFDDCDPVSGRGAGGD